ncbi:MAG: NAD(P)H-dependent glycerol-3-phosphate dehydrogenase [Fidelibacterota bacterium]
MSIETVTVLGCGSWGSALAQCLALQGHRVNAWHHNADKVKQFKSTRRHPNLPGFQFAKNITFFPDLTEALDQSRYVIIAVPSHAVRKLAFRLKGKLNRDSILVNVAKGVENQTLKTMSQVVQEACGFKKDLIVSLYGPSHAEEVIQRLPTTLVAAAENISTAEQVQFLFSSPFLRVYTNTDILGVELGGSIKNVIAIAAGICDGIGFGDNTKAALLTRGITEMTRLGVAMGARKETFSGLSGIGDLIATCLSKHSRNRYVGEEIGRGRKLGDILEQMEMVAEGVKTAQSVHDLKAKYSVEMPISQAIYNILFEDKDPKLAVTELMTRNLTREHNI